jgi:enoyl-[acyl-carrier protein] reductase I
MASALIFGVANKWSIAWSIARAWDAAGTNVIMVCRSDRERRTVEKLAHELQNNTTSSPVLTCDVTSEKELVSTFQQAHEMFDGTLDSVLHGVAAAPPGALGKPLHELTSEEFLATQHVSTYSLLAMVRHALPLMTATKRRSSSPASPSITTLSYIGSNRAVPGYGAMGCAKASLESSVRYLAHDVGSFGVRVNCISAPPAKTLSSRGIPNFQSMQNHAVEHSSLKRQITHDEIASYATFLASPQASGITGQVVYIDGGFNSVSMV